MKKRLYIALTLICALLLLSSCIFVLPPNEPWEDGKQKDTFFSDDVLSEHLLLGMPAVRIENSYLSEDGRELYCNLTDSEYSAYIEELVGFLISSETIKFRSFKCGEYPAGIGPFFIPIKGSEFAPLDERYTDFAASEHDFLISELSADGTDIPDYEKVRLTVTRETVEPRDSEFSYNVCIKFFKTSGNNYRYEPCHYSHAMKDASYPVPGMEKTITISTCSVCGYKEYSEYLPSEIAPASAVTVISGSEHVLEAPESTFENLVYTVKLKPSDEGDLRVVINGTEIPMSYCGSDYWGYDFIAPDGELEISVEVVE